MPNVFSVSGGVNGSASVTGSIRQLASVGGRVSVSSKSGKEIRFMLRSEFPERGSASILYVAVDQNYVYRYDLATNNYLPLTITVEELIRDEVVAEDSTWSSHKLDEVISAIEDQIGQKAEIYTQTVAEWEVSGNVRSRENVVYVYSDYEHQNGVNIPGVKIGDGQTMVNSLPFITDWILSGLVTDAERAFWNNKVTAYMAESVNGRLVLSKD